MSVKVRPYRGSDGWEVDITFRLPNGRRWRERSKAPVPSKSGAMRWGQDRERHLLQHGLPEPKKEVPTLKEFAPRFLQNHAVANRRKPSAIASMESIIRVRLVPMFGERKLDSITTEDIQRLKSQLNDRKAKTVNNALTVLNVLLKAAVEWGVIEGLPCTIRLVPTPKTTATFHDFDAYERLVGAAADLGLPTYILVLLGGDAGLRCGEMMALEWGDVDLARNQLRVARSDWRGHITTTKGGRVRIVPMTSRLATALRQHRHLRGRHVLLLADRFPMTQKAVQACIRRAAKNAGVPEGVHILRHTFCSLLAIRSAPARAIQDLAGHQNLSTTQRYMHLSPAELEGAIRLLDQTPPALGIGEILETEVNAAAKVNG